MTEIKLKLTQSEIRQLRQNAAREMRLPEQQAHFMLRRALGFDCGEQWNGGLGRQNENRAEQSAIYNEVG